MRIIDHKPSSTVLVITALFFFAGCAIPSAARKGIKAPPLVSLPVTIEKKDGLTELLGDGNRIFVRYITHKREYGAQDIILPNDYLKGKIVDREIEICFENAGGQVRVIKKLKDDKELEGIRMISRLKYSPETSLLAFTSERIDTIFVISTKSAQLIRKLQPAIQPRWSAQGKKLLYIDPQDRQEKEVIFLP
jgi:hypothetical protein